MSAGAESAPGEAQPHQGVGRMGDLPTGASRIRSLGAALPVAVFALASLALMPYFNGRLAADTTVYLDLGMRWAALDWANAVNAYWSPLIAWVIGLFVAVGFAPATAGQLSMVLSGAVVLVASRHLLRVIGASFGGRQVVLWSLVPLLVWLSEREVTPDLLMAGLLWSISLWSFTLTWRPSGAGRCAPA